MRKITEIQMRFLGGFATGSESKKWIECDGFKILIDFQFGIGHWRNHEQPIISKKVFYYEDEEAKKKIMKPKNYLQPYLL